MAPTASKTKKKPAKSKTASKTKAKKATTKKAPAKKASKAKAKTTPKKKVSKKSTPKPAKKKSANRQASKQTKAKAKATKDATTDVEASGPQSDETLLEMDDIADIEELVDDVNEPETPKKTKGKAQAKKKEGPKTPSVPRAVKPPPKDANLEMDDDVLEFVEAIDAYRQEHCRPFPNWTEVFYILRQLGYSKD